MGSQRGSKMNSWKKLRKTFFSFNLDEATSTTHHKVLTILVSYFCELCKEIIVEHLVSVNIPIMNAETVYAAVVDLVKSKEIPWKNLSAMLMDSCSVMRGSKNGFETKIRLRVAPHLLDIDGDSCHHIHNASKIFTKVFDGYLESLYRDIYNDFKWSEDLKVELRAICDHLGVTYRQPEMYASTRWLSIYVITVDTLYMFDALVVFYFPFLSPDHRKLYKSRLDDIYKRRQVSEISQKEIEKNQSYLKKKNLTKDGKERKQRIYKKLFFTKRKTRLQMSLFTAALLTVKRYVKVFQQNEPAIYRIYPEQFNVFRELLVDFIKPEVIAENKKVSQLKKVDFKSTKNQLPQSLISIGSVAYKTVKNSKKDNPTINEFLRNAMKAYADCVTYMAEKLPLENKFLKDVTAIDPKEITSCKSSTLKSLLNLPSLMENVLLDDEIDCYESECRRIIVDYDLSDVCTPDKKPVRGDLWWYKLIERYPILTKLSLAA